MKTTNLKFAVLGFVGLGLCACGRETPQVDTLDPGTVAYYEAILAETYISEDETAIDLQAVANALPDTFSLNWDTTSLDPDSGATGFTAFDLKYSGGAVPVGLKFEQLDLWGLDTELAVARLNGQRLDEAAPLLTRLDGQGMSLYGFDELLGSWVDAFIPQTSDFPDDFSFEFTIHFSEFEMQAERIVIVDVGLRPFEFEKISAEMLGALDTQDETEAFWPIVWGSQEFVAIARSFSMADYVVENAFANFGLTMPTEYVAVAYSSELDGATGIAGGDTAYTLSKNSETVETTRYIQDETMPGMADLFGEQEIVQTDLIGQVTVRDLKLDKAMGYFARGEWPDMSNRDLLSLGQFKFEDGVTKLNDGTVFTFETITADLSQFDWLIPTEIAFDISGAQLNTGELADVLWVAFAAGMESVAPEEDEVARAEYETFVEGLEKAIELMPEHGLSELPFNISFRAEWLADEGPADFAFTLDSDGFGQSDFELGLTFPTYEALRAIEAAEENEREELLETAFEEAFAMRGARFREEDKGGYDKLFGLAHALGKEFPQQGWGAMLSNMDPPQMRTYLGTIVRMAKLGAEQEFPPAVDWIEAYASFLEQGGAIEFAMNPSTPLDIEAFDTLEDISDPDAIVERLGISVIHTK